VTKLYVGNLPFSATDDSVRNLFSKYGTVEKVSLITDRETGRPRGFGFVEMSNADASRAMQALNGADFDGRPLKVNEAQDRERSGGGGGGNRGGPRRYEERARLKWVLIASSASSAAGCPFVRRPVGRAQEPCGVA
jgi:RNA recognition motif-containing protein